MNFLEPHNLRYFFVMFSEKFVILQNKINLYAKSFV